MKIVVKVRDAVGLARRFEVSPREAMKEVVRQAKEGVRQALQEVMETEIGLFLGQAAELENKRNGYTTRTFAIKGVGAVQLRVPRDRANRFQTNVIAPGKRLDEELERDVALLHVAGLSTRTLAQMSQTILGTKLSHTEVSRAMTTLLPSAKAFLDRPLDAHRYKYLYVDGTYFHIRRSTVELEPTLVVLGVDEQDRRSVLAMVQGDKDAVDAWRMVFAHLKERGLDPTAVQLGIMDGLPGLQTAFREAFRNARTARCWVHKARNVMARVPRRYQPEFKKSWDTVAYASDGVTAREAYDELKKRWKGPCGDAVEVFERDLDALYAHYDFPQQHWDALRTTNPIERINKEFKRRSKAMEVVGPESLKVLLAFTALRLEFGWSTTTICSNKLSNLTRRVQRENELKESVVKGLIN